MAGSTHRRGPWPWLLAVCLRCCDERHSRHLSAPHGITPLPPAVWTTSVARMGTITCYDSGQLFQGVWGARARALCAGNGRSTQPQRIRTHTHAHPRAPTRLRNRTHGRTRSTACPGHKLIAVPARDQATGSRQMRRLASTSIDQQSNNAGGGSSSSVAAQQRRRRWQGGAAQG